MIVFLSIIFRFLFSAFVPEIISGENNISSAVNLSIDVSQNWFFEVLETETEEENEKKVQISTSENNILNWLCSNFRKPEKSDFDSFPPIVISKVSPLLFILFCSWLE